MASSVVSKVETAVTSGFHPVTKILSMTKPTFVNGRWRKPKLSRRRIAEVGKKMLQYPGGELAREALQYWTLNNKARLPELTPESLGNFHKDPLPRRKPKGIKHERQRENR